MIELAGERSLGLALPVLAGPAEEWLLPGGEEAGDRDGYTTYRSHGRQAGFVVAESGQSLEAAASDLYRRLFAATEGLHLHRIWNYVPRINAQGDGVENYRRFCRGRSLAFERHFGADFKKHLPAASAVGAPVGPLAVAYLAGREWPRHFENPRQVPAFEYPVQYGPRPPSFARATVVGDTAGRRVYISGTAAIRGHATVAPGDLDGQLDCLVENLRLISTAAGAGADLGAGGDRSFKVYVRRPQDCARVAERLGAELWAAGDTVCYLQADVCRAELLVEVEAVLEFT